VSRRLGEGSKKATAVIEKNIRSDGNHLGKISKGVAVHDQSDIEDDDQDDPGKSEKQVEQQPVFEQWVDLAAEERLGGGQEDSYPL
jgi:hypothetical protein